MELSNTLTNELYNLQVCITHLTFRTHTSHPSGHLPMLTGDALHVL